MLSSIDQGSVESKLNSNIHTKQAIHCWQLFRSGVAESRSSDTGINGLFGYSAEAPKTDKSIDYSPPSAFLRSLFQETRCFRDRNVLFSSVLWGELAVTKAFGCCRGCDGLLNPFSDLRFGEGGGNARCILEVNRFCDGTELSLVWSDRLVMILLILASGTSDISIVYKYLVAGWYPDYYIVDSVKEEYLLRLCTLISK